jgi:hypothetical protein
VRTLLRRVAQTIQYKKSLNEATACNFTSRQTWWMRRKNKQITENSFCHDASKGVAYVLVHGGLGACQAHIIVDVYEGIFICTYRDTYIDLVAPVLSHHFKFLRKGNANAEIVAISVPNHNANNDEQKKIVAQPMAAMSNENAL